MYKCKPLQELHIFENTKLISAQLYKSLDRKIRHDHFRKDRQTSLEVCLKNSLTPYLLKSVKVITESGPLRNEHFQCVLQLHYAVQPQCQQYCTLYSLTHILTYIIHLIKNTLCSSLKTEKQGIHRANSFHCSIKPVARFLKETLTFKPQSQ